MDIKLCLVGVFCLTMATGGYAKQSQPGLVNTLRQGVMQELVTCKAERTVMMQLINIIREIEQDLLFDDADNVKTALQSIFEGASSLGDAISQSSESSSEETTESATTTATEPSTPATTESTTSATTEPTTADSTTGSASSATTVPNKRMIQLKKDLLRALLLKKLKGHSNKN